MPVHYKQYGDAAGIINPCQSIIPFFGNNIAKKKLHNNKSEFVLRIKIFGLYFIQDSALQFSIQLLEEFDRFEVKFLYTGFRGEN